MKVRRLDDVLRARDDGELRDFEPGWYPTADGGFENPKFGAIRHVVICDNDGSPLWDQPEISEYPGSIIIPCFLSTEEEYNLGLIKKNYAIIECSKTGVQGAVISTEFPRGFAIERDADPKETVKRVLSKETSDAVQNIHYLGSINPLTSHYRSQKANEVFAARVDPNKVFSASKRELSDQAKKEGILSSSYHSLKHVNSMVNSGEIFCGLTQAALAKFICKYEL